MGAPVGPRGINLRQGMGMPAETEQERMRRLAERKATGQDESERAASAEGEYRRLVDAKAKSIVEASNLKVGAYNAKDTDTADILNRFAALTQRGLLGKRTRQSSFLTGTLG